MALSAAWPEPVARVSAYLRQAGAEARIEEFAGETASADDAATALGTPLEQIVKTLVFDCDGGLVVALVPGDLRADRAKLAAAAGCRRAQIVGAGDVERLTGFPPGAVAPFPLPAEARAFVDRNLLVHDRVWIGAGSSRHLACLAPVELVRLARAQTVDITADG